MGLAALAFLTFQTGTPYIVASLVVLGLGFALFSSPNMSAIMGALAKKDYGIASGAVATMRLLGQMVSMAVATMVLSLMIGQQAITPENYSRFLVSSRMIFSVSVFLCSVGIFFSMFRGRLRQG